MDSIIEKANVVKSYTLTVSKKNVELGSSLIGTQHRAKETHPANKKFQGSYPAEEVNQHKCNNQKDKVGEKCRYDKENKTQKNTNEDNVKWNL